MKLFGQRASSNGSITIFLTLILLIILSLLLTIIEGARVNTARVFAQRSLTASMDSVLAEYYRPLWEEYHLFGLDTGYGGKDASEEEVINRLQENMSYTFDPNRDLDNSVIKEGAELYDISVGSLNLTNRTMLMDYDGKLFVNEAVEYMKYEELGDAAELLLNKLSLLKGPSKVSYLYEEKQNVEEQLVEIDEGILELMELLDGIKTSKKGIEVNKDHSLKTVDYFVKKIANGVITKEMVGINQDGVFQALKENYTNPQETMDKIDSLYNYIIKTYAKLKKTEANYNSTVSEIAAVNTKLDELNSIDDKTKSIKSEIKETEQQLNELEGQRDVYYEQKGQYEDVIVIDLNQISHLRDRLFILIHEVKPKVEGAITIVDKILKKTEGAAPLIKEYEDMLKSEKGNVDESIYAGLEEQLGELKRYTSEGTEGYHFKDMKDILEHDLSVLNEAEQALDHTEEQLYQGGFEVSKENFAKIGKILQGYRIDGLTLDYSTLVLEKDEDKNPINKVNSFAKDGITGLVIDPETISKLALTDEVLPSELHSMAEGDGGFLFDFTSFFKDIDIGDKNGGAGGLFGSFSASTDGLSMASDGINWVAEQLLFQEYLKEHFTSYPKEGEDIKSRKPSALTYEREYLLNGRRADKDNLSSIISRVVFVRSMLDFVSLLKDKTRCSEAKVAAAALVGFTGLPILVTITQTLILLTWAFAEALVDTCALMMGKEVDVFKNSLVLNFTDLFLLSRDFIKEKASQMIKTSEGLNGKTIRLSYQDYLNIFLFLKSKEDLAFRSMDLIQENIQIRYADSFYLQNVLFGMKAKAEFIIKPKFITFASVKKYITNAPAEFLYHSEAAYSY